MTDVFDMKAHRRISELEGTLEAKLKGGGGGPYDGDMDHRVTALETRLDTILPTLATKGDLAELRTGFAEVKSDVKSSLSELKTLISDGKVDVQRWMLGTVVGLFIGFGGLFLAMSNALKPAATPASTATQAPIIINVPTQPSPPAPATQAPRK